MRTRIAQADWLLAPLLTFVFVYGATLILLVSIRFPFVQWIGLGAVSVATVTTIAIWERGQWPLGLFVPARFAVPELLRGLLWGFLLIAACMALIMTFTDIRSRRGDGFPWLELLLVFAPAVVHEELLFRGYPFQKLLRWNRTFALFFVAFLFAALHANNESVTALGLLNVFLGGMVLALAYERYGRLWFPIGFHLAWNLTTGPVFGHEVSGYETMHSILMETGGGPDVLTGGEFGVEGSVLMTVVELAAIALLVRRISSARPAFGQHGNLKE
ncbi:MAG: CPBP family intramembrane glutamic endopeptidase [Thermoanaerobaculia bacterium]